MSVELSRPWKADTPLAGEVVVDVAAETKECAAVAERLGVPAVAELDCRFRLARVPAEAGRIVAQGRLRARLTRECVVSLDEFQERIDEEFRVRFVPEGAESDDDDPETDDEIPYAGSTIDLGEAAVEQLALAMSPYPRKPGAELGDDAGPQAASPFAALGQLKPRN